MRKWVLVVVLVLAGCDQEPTAADIAASDDATCRSYGAQPGSDAYVQCREQIQQERIQDFEERRQLLLEYLQSHQ